MFFAAAALACYAIARDRRRAAWWWLSGACAGLAMLCHGNTFWVAAILGIWLLLDYGWRVFGTSATWCVAGGLGVTVGPYAAIVLSHWTEVQRQVNAFVPERVPMYTIAGLLHQIRLEPARYRTWYFGLVTNGVPNPLLMLFQLMTAAGVLWLAWRALSRRGDADGAIHVLTLVIGSVVIFAALVNNKVPVYMPHLLIGFSLAAGFSVTESARPRRAGMRAGAPAGTPRGRSPCSCCCSSPATVRRRPRTTRSGTRARASRSSCRTSAPRRRCARSSRRGRRPSMARRISGRRFTLTGATPDMPPRGRSMGIDDGAGGRFRTIARCTCSWTNCSGCRT